MAIVYTHNRLDNNQVFYVGIGTKESRAYSKNRSTFWRNMVHKFGYTINITHKNIIWEEACVIEKYLINFYGRKDLNNGQLCNLTDGGDGICGFKKSEEMKKKHSITMLGKKNMLGKKHSAETIEKIKIKNKGKIRSEECKLKLKESFKNRKFSDITRKKISVALSGTNSTWYGKFGKEHNCSKEVSQYTIQGNFVNSYGSTREAKRKTNISHISSCCNKKRKTAGGYIWKYT